MKTPKTSKLTERMVLHETHQLETKDKAELFSGCLQIYMEIQISISSPCTRRFIFFNLPLHSHVWCHHFL